MIEKLEHCLDVLAERGIANEGFIPSVLDLDGNSISEMPSAIEGQRNHDRAYGGSNLIHDEPLLLTLRELGHLWNKQSYLDCSNAYFKNFSHKCSKSATGLFPWGEHAFWNYQSNNIGNSQKFMPWGKNSMAVHDHLRFVPEWMWEEINTHNPACVQGFGHGLDAHWEKSHPNFYNRHALLDHEKIPNDQKRFCDFPRYSGFFIYDLAFAWIRSRDPQLYRSLNKYLDYWWERKEANGLLMHNSSYSPDDKKSINLSIKQSISLAASLYDTHVLLSTHDEALANTIKSRADVYLEAVLSVQEKMPKGIFVESLCSDKETVNQCMPIWGSKYGHPPAASSAISLLSIYRKNHDERLVRWAISLANALCEIGMTGKNQVPAIDMGLNLNLFALLYEETREEKWLKKGLEFAETASKFYFVEGSPLIRGATKISWYESQMGPGYLINAMARLIYLDTTQNPKDGIASSFSAR